MPLLGAYMADQHWGRFRTIMISIGIALVGHTILIISAIPSVIARPGGSIACFTIGLVIMGVGTGGFKYAHLRPSLSGLLLIETLTGPTSHP